MTWVVPFEPFRTLSPPLWSVARGATELFARTTPAEKLTVLVPGFGSLPGYRTTKPVPVGSTVTFRDTERAEAGTPQTPARLKRRIWSGWSAGPPRGPSAARVSTARHGESGWNLAPPGVGVGVGLGVGEGVAVGVRVGVGVGVRVGVGVAVGPGHVVCTVAAAAPPPEVSRRSVPLIPDVWIVMLSPAPSWKVFDAIAVPFWNSVHVPAAVMPEPTFAIVNVAWLAPSHV